MQLSRRHLLASSAAMLGALAVPLRIGRAASASDLKFVFVFNQGGWDPTRTFAPVFSNNVSLEAGSELATAGGIDFIDHPNRPSVAGFLQQHHANTLVFNGVMVRSIAHEICTMISLTGSSSGSSPDWPAQLADARRDAFILPHLVLDGPSFPGDRGVSVARTGSSGQLAALLSGDAIGWSDLSVAAPVAPAEDLVDRFMAGRVAARADASRSALDAALADAYLQSADKARALQDLQYAMDFATGFTLDDQARVAVDALRLGLSRCVTMTFPGSWDTHATNDALQAPMWEQLFAGLSFLMALLQATPGESAATLADETVVVVMSEMGRTPLLNQFEGKDHWPYTSTMLVGPGLNGDRVVGGFDDSFYGRPIDLESGEINDDSATLLTAENVGATLLAMADVDPAEVLATVDPIGGVIA